MAARKKPRKPSAAKPAAPKSKSAAPKKGKSTVGERSSSRGKPRASVGEHEPARAEPPSAMEDGVPELRQIDVIYFIEPSPAIKRAVNKLNEKLIVREHDSLVQGAVLPADESAPYYLSFHVDEEDGQLLVHLAYLRKPNTPPPAVLVEHLKAGMSVESVSVEFEKWARKADSYIVTTKVYVSQSVGPVAVALPSKVIDGRAFDLTGAEFRTKDDCDGLRRFSWREMVGGGQLVEFSHLTDSFDWDEPWRSEVQKCRTHLEMIS